MKEKTGVIHKAFTVLRAFLEVQPEWGIRDLAKHLGFSVTTLHRLVSQLTDEGILEQDLATNKYTIGIEMVRMGSIISSENNMTKITRRYMEEISSKYNESVYLIIYNSSLKKISFVDRVNGTNLLQYVINLGEYLPVPYAAAGKAVLSNLPSREVNMILEEENFSEQDQQELIDELVNIREVKYSTSEGERVKGVKGIASPILNHTGYPVGAIACVIPFTRVTPNLVEEVINDIKEAGEDISKILGYK